jgi:peptidylprolyl isomerase
MKLTTALLVLACASAQLLAQTSATPAAPAHHTAPATAAHPSASKGGCVKVPDLSPKIPPLAPGMGCPRALYTLTTVPNIKVDYVSPLEGTGLPETLGVDPSSFSLVYVDVQAGKGALAAPHQFYTIHYTGYLIDGTKFDSSYDHPDHQPYTFQYGAHQVVAGWDTGFAGMRVGGKRRLFIPFQLGYGPNAHGQIPPKSWLIFDLEFISQSEKAPPPPPAPAAAKPPAAAPPALGLRPMPSTPPTSSAPPPAAQPAMPAPAPATAPATPAPGSAPKPQ